MKITITGSAGFIGWATVREATRRGHQVLPFDKRFGDEITSVRDVHNRVRDGDAVIHLAGVLGTAELYDRRDTAVDVNIKGTMRVLEACLDHGKPFVGITQPNCWTNVYQATRIAAQQIALGFNRDFGVAVTFIRAFNGYGPRQLHGPGHPKKIIPTLATESWNGRPMPIWDDGEQLVDLVHVDDVAWRLVGAAEGGDGTGDGQIWDAGTGRPITVNEVARRVGDVTGNHAVEHLPMRPGETPGTIIRATNFGPWPPRTTDDDELERLAETVRWYKP